MVLIGLVKPDLANALGAALADDSRLRVLESDILGAIHRAVLGATREPGRSDTRRSG
jgi:hypothetical protein